MKRRGMSPEEEKLLEIAKENHWIHKAGTPLQHMGNLMKHEGMKVDRRYNATTEDIKEALERGDGIIVAVDSDKLYPERPDEEDATNHAVVVTGINSESVTIFDPGNIAEIDIPLQLFMSAWRESKYYIVCARPIIEKK